MKFRDLISTNYWVVFTIGAIVFVLGIMALTMYNQSKGLTTLEEIAGDATFYHPAVILAALKWPWGFPTTGLLVAISAGFLSARNYWAKPLGLFLFSSMFIVYLAVAYFIAGATRYSLFG